MMTRLSLSLSRNEVYISRFNRNLMMNKTIRKRVSNQKLFNFLRHRITIMVAMVMIMVLKMMTRKTRTKKKMV